MNRSKQVELQIRTATLKSRVQKLEVIGSMKTRITGPMPTAQLMAQITQHLFITERNHLVIDSRTGMRAATTPCGKLQFVPNVARSDPEVEEDSESDGDDAWPGGLPTFSLADVLEEAKRLSIAARLHKKVPVSLYEQASRIAGWCAKLNVAVGPALSNRGLDGDYRKARRPCISALYFMVVIGMDWFPCSLCGRWRRLLTFGARAANASGRRSPGVEKDIQKDYRASIDGDQVDRYRNRRWVRAREIKSAEDAGHPETSLQSARCTRSRYVAHDRICFAIHAWFAEQGDVRGSCIA